MKLFRTGKASGRIIGLAVILIIVLLLYRRYGTSTNRTIVQSDTIRSEIASDSVLEEKLTNPDTITSLQDPVGPER